MRLTRAFLLTALLTFGAAEALAQWQVPDNAVPAGRGSGRTGFKTIGPCAPGEVIMGQGAGSPPVCSTATITTVDTIAALKALPGPFTNGQTIYIRGWSANDDGGQGLFIYNSTSATLADDGVVVTPTVNGVGNGRFIRDTQITFGGGGAPRHVGIVESAWFGDTPNETDANRQSRIQNAVNLYTQVNLRPGVTYNLPTVATTGATVKAQIWIKFSNQTLDCQGATIRRQNLDFSPGDPPSESRNILYVKSAAAATFIENINVVNCNFNGNNINNAGIGTTSCCTFVQDNNIVLSYIRNYSFRDTVSSNAIASAFAAAASDNGSIINLTGADNGKETVYLSDDGGGGAAISRRVLISNLRSSGSNFDFGQSGGSYFASVCTGGITKCTYPGLGVTTDNVIIDGYYSIDDASGISVTAVGSPLDNNIDFSLSNFYISQSAMFGQQVFIGNAIATDAANFNKNIQVVNGTIKGPGTNSGFPGFQLSGVRKANIANVTIIGAGATGLYLDQSTGSQTATVTNVTSANPIVVTAASHGYATGERVSFSGLAGGMGTSLNGLAGTVTFINSNSFSVNINGSGFPAYTSGGTTTPIIPTRDVNISGVTVQGSFTNGVTIRATDGVNFNGLVLRSNGGWGLQAISDGSGTASNANVSFKGLQFLDNVGGTADITNVSSTGTTTCSNQFIHSINAFGVGSCASVNLATMTTGVLAPENGGTGVANAAAETITIAGGFGLTLTLTNTTNVTLPSGGTLVTRTGTETLTNKTLTAPIISTISNTGTLTLPTSTDTLVGRATTDTLTNKTLTLPTIASIDNGGTITIPSGAGTFVTLAAAQTLTNKALTAASLSTPTITRPFGGGGVPVATTGSGAGGCGTGPVTVSGSDTVGIVVLSASPNATTCQITFSTAWGGAGVVCMVNNISTGTPTYMSVATATTMTMTGTFVAGHLLAYMCMGRP